MTDPRWALAVHGGSGIFRRDTMPADIQAGSRAGLNAALDAGSAILAQGGGAVDAVAAAVAILEDDPHFNAGRGAALSADGHAELDAAIMAGDGRCAGAVAQLRRVRNPVMLARKVMDASPHVFLAGAGAEAFAVEQGFALVDPDWFVLAERRAQLAELLASDDPFDRQMKYGTVGAVACDAHGHVAAATSTGGITGKRWGRIGDTPVIGAGTYADDRAAAVSATGSGEHFQRAAAGYEICALIRLCECDIATASARALSEVQALGGTGGVIVASPAGELHWSFTTPGMFRGRANSAGERVVAIFGDEA
ncbi:MAG: isoaspartyl peptidase/L-asparaginase [Pseudomonadota bacterium]